MSTQKLVAIIVAPAAAVAGVHLAGLDLSVVWAPRQLLLVVALPYVILALSSGALAGPRAVGTALRSDLGDLPSEVRETAGSILRELGGLGVAVGAISFLLDLLTLLATLTATSGNAAPMETVVGLGSALVGPIYGLFAKALLYDPLATAVEPTPGELAAALG